MGINIKRGFSQIAFLSFDSIALSLGEDRPSFDRLLERMLILYYNFWFCCSTVFFIRTDWVLLWFL